MTFAVAGDTTWLPAQSAAYTHEQLKKIKEVPPGTLVQYQEIRGSLPGSLTRKFPPFWIRIE